MFATRREARIEEFRRVFNNILTNQLLGDATVTRSEQKAIRTRDFSGAAAVGEFIDNLRSFAGSCRVDYRNPSIAITTPPLQLEAATSAAIAFGGILSFDGSSFITPATGGDIGYDGVRDWYSSPRVQISPNGPKTPNMFRSEHLIGVVACTPDHESPLDIGYIMSDEAFAHDCKAIKFLSEYIPTHHWPNGFFTITELPLQSIVLKAVLEELEQAVRSNSQKSKKEFSTTVVSGLTSVSIEECKDPLGMDPLKGPTYKIGVDLQTADMTQVSRLRVSQTIEKAKVEYDHFDVEVFLESNVLQMRFLDDRNSEEKWNKLFGL